jgi:CRISPR-associated protein Cmr2
LKALGQETPLPYYAILAADGDRMGKAIQQQTTVAGHQALSRALDRFARQTAGTVEEEHRGELIYAGGDDVLAFVPLDRVLSCALALKDSFHSHLQGFPAGEAGAPPTLSVGIGISHFLEPMGRALALARRAESLAKETRNALAVILDKRSGPPIESSGLWGTIDSDLGDFTRLHCEDLVPDGAAYELRDLTRLLTPRPPDGSALEDLVAAEATGILKRKQPQHGDETALAEKTLKRLVDVLKREGIGALSDRLLIGRILADATLAAEPPAEGENR